MTSVDIRLAIVGSRNFVDLLWREKATGSINAALEDLTPSLIISGGADGIDKLAEEIATRHGIATKIYLPKNNQWEPDGYKDRNYLIAGACTHLLCIRSGSSVSYGSGWTADRAEEMMKIVKRVSI